MTAKCNKIFSYSIGILCIIVIATVFLFVNYEKCIRTEYKNIEVKIIEANYTPSYLTTEYDIPLKVMKTITVPEVYQIIVEYDKKEYILNGSEVYTKYKDKVGQNVMAICKVSYYKNGFIEYEILSLE